ncbi:MAG: GNAT family N-acetyltransferase [Pseudonocardiales bacterium]|nr:MAG: GNAT family N-acetyltransferase [Pseudonocardiales bacterium]
MVSSAPAIEIGRLEAVAALGWRAPDTARLGDWLLRAAEGWTGRGNSVLPLGEPDRPMDEALGAVREWYAERGLPARFQVPLPLCGGLDAALAMRGWRAYNPTLVRIATVERVLQRLGDPGGLPPATLEEAPTAAWLAAYHYRGSEGPPPIAAAVMTAADNPVFASVVVDDDVAGIARAVVDYDTDGLGWCGITALETAPAWRRRGIGRQLMRGVLRWAVRGGAALIYLQVMEDNAAAHAMYDQLGFVTSHRYHYRTPA